MYEIAYGPKFERGLDITDIAKCLRKEIREAVKAGELPKCKYSVRIQRFSGGQALDVTIKEFPRAILNRRWLEVEHGLSKGPNMEQRRDLSAERDTTGRYTDEVVELIKALEQMVGQWNYDGSETQVDYFHVNYYSSVSIDTDQSHAEWVRVTEEIKAADCGLRISDPERVA